MLFLNEFVNNYAEKGVNVRTINIFTATAIALTLALSFGCQSKSAQEGKKGQSAEKVSVVSYLWARTLVDAGMLIFLPPRLHLLTPSDDVGGCWRF